MDAQQCRIKTKLGLMLLPRKGPIFFSAFKTDQLATQPPFTERGYITTHTVKHLFFAAS